MSKDWMDLPRYRKEYIDGVISFLEFAYYEGELDRNKFNVLVRCYNMEWYRRHVVFDYLVADKFVKGYKTWINYGEWTIPIVVDDDRDDEEGAPMTSKDCLMMHLEMYLTLKVLL
ncbi:hypothetical protein AHAS_Ahas05G0212000 [Arachis hypogaea]